MDLHKLGEERSLAFHRVIADRLMRQPEVLDTARRRVREWVTLNPERPFVQEWSRILAGEPESIAQFITERSERAVELRQSSPFAGVLKPRERWRIWRETRQNLTGEK